MKEIKIACILNIIFSKQTVRLTGQEVMRISV